MSGHQLYLHGGQPAPVFSSEDAEELRRLLKLQAKARELEAERRRILTLSVFEVKLLLVLARPEVRHPGLTGDDIASRCKHLVSAGRAYPLLDRFAARGWVLTYGQPVAEVLRTKYKLHRITPAGIAALLAYAQFLELSLPEYVK